MPEAEGRFVHALFLQAALNFRDRVAATSGDEEITYGTLAGCATALARRLVAVGVGPDRVVGLHGERSLEMMVAMVAVTMAGGAFLFLDPAYPDERLDLMIEDSGARLVLAPPGEGARYSGLAAEILVVDLRSEQVDGIADASFPHYPRLGPDHMAYLVYTSGTTGRPKAVAVTHRNLASFVQSRNLIDHGPGDVVLGLSSLCFDASIFEIWGAFACGATVALYRPRAFDLVELARVMTEREVRRAFLTPALFYRLVEDDPALVRRFDHLWIGGEAPRPEMFARFLAMAPHCRLINSYGPTEATSITLRHIYRGDRPEYAPLPLGEGVGETVPVVLDDALLEVARGGEGELYLAGPQIARGYHRRPGLTATRFIAAPGGGRYYRTGDRVRLTPAGEILFIGRADRQIKLRGFRIEPGEIEAAIRRLAGIACLVTVRSPEGGAPRLVAYLESRRPIDVPALRADLSAALPWHLVPSRFVRLDAFPLTINGKIDHGALPDPGDDGAEPAALPATPTENFIVELCGKHLGAPRLDVETDLLVAGLDSLGATRLAARVRAELGKEVPLRAILECRTARALAAWIDGEARAADATPAFTIAEEPGSLSPAQERFWFLDRLGRAGSAYHIVETLSLTGGLDRSALARALGALIERHPMLRATIGGGPGGPELRIGAPSGAVELEDLRLDGLGAKPAREMVREFAERPFNLESGPLFRAGVGRLGADRHWLTLVMHHIVSDGWSILILLRDLARLYKLAERGEDLAGPPPEGDYRDYIARQRLWLASADFTKQLDYWRTALQGAPQASPMPTDYPRPAELSHRGAVHGFTLGSKAVSKVAVMAALAGTTPYVVLMTAYLLMLRRWSGQTDLIVATPVAGRDAPEFEAVVGLFVNTVPIRVRLDEDQTLGSLIARVRDAVLGAFENASLPFDRLVDALRPDRSLSSHALAQLSFTMEIPADVRQDWSPLVAVPLPAAQSSAKLELSLYVSERQGGLSGYFEYATDLYRPERIARMAESWAALLDSFDRLERRVSALPCLTAADQRLLTRLWGVGPRPAEAVPMHRLLDGWAERAPERIALQAGDETVTYGALAERSARLARRLVKRGVVRGTLVGLCLGRSVEMVVALYAILKAGGAFVPLDPDDPPARLASMVEEAGLALVVARDDFQAEVAAHGVRVIDPGQDAEAIAAESGAVLPHDCDPEQLAYVMFTSGSTGRPKGVAVRHGGLANIVAHQRTAFEVTPEDRVLQFARMCFDAAVWDIGLAIGSGATLVLAPRPVPLGRALAAFLDQAAISVATLPPSVLASLEGQSLDSVRLLMVAGEACPTASARRWRNGRRFVNAYGPTEFTICATHHDYLGGDAVPVGAPVAGARLYVLDPFLELAPIGAEGELYLGGESLARGYLGRPGLTAERFIADPFTPGARLYRTGDRVRWDADGALHFIGRADRQIKLRGYRIELAEVESALEGLEGVAQAAVTIRADGTAPPQLLAWVVLRPGADAAMLREGLARRLPAHMVPSTLAVLPELPLTPNGKIDHAALLRIPGPSLPESGTALPTTPTEAALIEIACAVLGRETLSINDNFFDVGGNSLILTRFVDQIEQRLGVFVEMVSVFRQPTIAALARLIDGFDSRDDDPGADEDALDRATLARRRRQARASILSDGSGGA